MTATDLVQQVQNLMAAHKGALTTELPTHLQSKGAAWLTGALAAVRKDPNLMQAALTAPDTFITALSTAARLGLAPGTEQFYLTPRKVKGKMEVLGIRGYQGEIELIYRAGAVSSIIVETVHKNDSFTYVIGEDTKPIHKPDHFGNRGELIGAYAYAIMKDGATSKVVIVDPDRIAKAKADSPGSSSEYSPWTKHPRAMYMKTAVHELAKYVPSSAERITEPTHAEAVQDHQTPPPETATVVASEVIPHDPVTGEVNDEGAA